MSWSGGRSTARAIHVFSVMARDFLAVQPTSVAPEDLFCSKGDEIDKQRFCMPHDSTQAILCIRSWMQGGIKLKCKSDEIDYERVMEMAGATTAENTAGLDKKQRMDKRHVNE
ncbi:hypothetical protein NC653_028491 [Populus alba x Populus x berolinensis]|uniref:HAT C-terminal dimerisation domain-containing protein n=1 Tax=Populus alba x Populus x berolinensis TaxID=444605 RepID=A0AAD6M007_9ROSI|nr:hypothetical protein NC653_028491 [Populus alba x Populus x berolinensis]